MNYVLYNLLFLLPPFFFKKKLWRYFLAGVWTLFLFFSTSMAKVDDINCKLLSLYLQMKSRVP